MCKVGLTMNNYMVLFYIIGNIYYLYRDLRLYIEEIKNNMKTNTMKTALGIVLVLLAIAALFFWEAEGRELLLMDEVLIADEDIKIGDLIDAEKLRIVAVPTGTLVDKAVVPKYAERLTGKEATVDIIAGAQLSWRFLQDKDAAPRPETSYFVIRNEWIYMCSSSLRRGDKVLITSADGKSVLGSYTIAFVKDGDGREITNASSGMYSFTGSGNESDRVNTSAPIHHIEIECELKDYRRIAEYCAGKISAPLMLVREMS